MEILFTKHAEEKFIVMKRLGWTLTKAQIKETISSSQWRGSSRFGQKTAMTLVDKNHILRVIMNQEGDIITVVTFHIARRGKYESTL